jgi:hypothetical protein
MYARHKKRISCFEKLDVLYGVLEASSTKKFPLPVIILISIHFSNNFAAEKRAVRVQKKILWSNTKKTRKSLSRVWIQCLIWSQCFVSTSDA